jgi:hydroxypyruvate reductase
MLDAPQLLADIYRSAVDACHPRRVIPPALPGRPSGRIFAVAAGKAAAAMAGAVEACWGSFDGGIVVTRSGHEADVASLPVILAAHPVPDEAGLAAGRAALGLVEGLGEEDTVLALLSGGGSALLAAPLRPLGLDDKRLLTRTLVLSGAPIEDINCVRRHLSAIKGGRLAARAWPARVLTIAISDVVGDDPTVIASGPTVADPSTRQDALAILAKHRIEIPDAVQRLLSNPESETVKPGDPRLSRSDFATCARGADLVSAACDAAQRLGIRTQVLGVNLQGIAREVGHVHGEIARQAEARDAPLLLLSGGELTVSVRGHGHGGPNREYLLALAEALQGHSRIWALAADSDGIDGSDHVAGGWIGPDTLVRARSAGLDVRSSLERNDSAIFFRSLGQEIITGPTRTNVNDLRAILITASL